MLKKQSVFKNVVADKSKNLLSLSFPFSTFVQKHLRYITVGIIFIFLFVAGFLVWKYLNNKKEEQAMAGYFQAYKVYEESVKQEKSLEQPLQLFQSVAEKYQGTSAEALSLFYTGNCQFAMKKYDKAIASYNNFLKSLPAKTSLVLIAYDSLGYCYEEKKDFNNAIKFFKKTITPHPGLGENGCLNIARCYESLGDKENSLAFYNKVVVGYPDSSRINFVREKIRLLKSKS